MTTTVPSSNGHIAGEPTPADTGDSLARLRQRPVNGHVLRGYGPLVVGAILFVLMVLLAPTVAPERVVERPVDAPAATGDADVTTTTTAAPDPEAP